ncbi:MAG: alginate lyase family protein [Fibrobacteres bacterium]|nr:alginate lyase family protein [Fibrobacterota bacterium]
MVKPFFVVLPLVLLVSRSAQPTSPRITRFQLLDLLAPGVSLYESIQKLRTSKGDSTALAELAKYFRTRKSPGWPPTERHPKCPDDAIADSAKKGTHTAIGLWHHSGIDSMNWHHDPTGEGGIPKNPEWIYGLNRHYWWAGLACYSKYRGDTSAARTLIQEFESWKFQNPPPIGRANYRGSAWRTFEAGIRMHESWPKAFENIRISPILHDTTMLDMVALMLDHASYIENFKTDHNWLAMEMDGLHAVGSYFPEFATSTHWRKIAIHTIDSAMSYQILPDGVQEELSPSYHALTLKCIRSIIIRSRETQNSNEIPQRLLKTLERGYDVFPAIWLPNGKSPRLNDSHEFSIQEVLGQGLQLFPNHPDWRWIYSNGKEGNEPTFKNKLFSWAGWCIFRTSWQQDANVLIFDRGPTGKGHHHQDKLSISAWSFGRQILFDDGGGPYEDSPFRSFAKSTAAHSTFLVDNLGQNRAPEAPSRSDSTGWNIGKASASAIGIYEDEWGSKKKRLARHERSVEFFPDHWVVTDRIQSQDGNPHTATGLWQILSTNLSCDSIQCQTTDSGQSNLAIVPLCKPLVNITSGQTTPYVSGWYIGLEKKIPATTLAYNYLSGKQINATTILVPIHEGEISPVIGIRRGKTSTIINLRGGSHWEIKSSNCVKNEN